jgi:hypothetical protein
MQHRYLHPEEDQLTEEKTGKMEEEFSGKEKQ